MSMNKEDASVINELNEIRLQEIKKINNSIAHNNTEQTLVTQILEANIKTVLNVHNSLPPPNISLIKDCDLEEVFSGRGPITNAIVEHALVNYLYKKHMSEFSTESSVDSFGAGVKNEALQLSKYIIAISTPILGEGRVTIAYNPPTDFINYMREKSTYIRPNSEANKRFCDPHGYLGFWFVERTLRNFLASYFETNELCVYDFSLKDNSVYRVAVYKEQHSGPNSIAITRVGQNAQTKFPISVFGVWGRSRVDYVYHHEVENVTGVFPTPRNQETEEVMAAFFCRSFELIESLLEEEIARSVTRAFVDEHKYDWILTAQLSEEGVSETTKNVFAVINTTGTLKDETFYIGAEFPYCGDGYYQLSQREDGTRSISETDLNLVMFNENNDDDAKISTNLRLRFENTHRRFMEKLTGAYSQGNELYINPRDTEFLDKLRTFRYRQFLIGLVKSLSQLKNQ